MHTFILTPTTSEARPIAERLKLKPSGQISWSSGGVSLHVLGVGSGAADRVPDLPELSAGLPRVLVVGLGGALDPVLQAGDVCRPVRVVNETGGSIPLDGTGLDEIELLSTSRIIVDAGQKTVLRRQVGAAVIDMETYAIAERLSGRVNLGALRVISDDAQTTLPPGIEDWLHPEGVIAPWGLARSLLRRPDRWFSTARFMRQAAKATATLAQAVANEVEAKA